MATPTLDAVSRGAIDVNLQQTIPGATVRNQLSGDLRTSYQAQWDTGGPGSNIKNSNTWNHLGTDLDNDQITMFILEGTSDYQKQQMVAWRDQCIDPDRDETREFIFQITVNVTFTSTGAWHSQSKYTSFARYFGSSDWNGRVDRIYMGLINDQSVGGNAVTSTASSSTNELITKVATGDLNGLTYSLSGITIFFDAQEDDTLGPPNETNHNFKSNFLDDVCLNDVDTDTSTRVLALNTDDCIIETTIPSSAFSTTYVNTLLGGVPTISDPNTEGYTFNAGDFEVRAGSGVGEDHQYIIELSDTGVITGSPTNQQIVVANADLTIDRHGRILAAANGTPGGGGGRFLESFTVNTAASRGNSWSQTFDLNYDDDSTLENPAFSLAAVARTHVRTDAQTTNTEVFDDLIFDDNHFTIVAGTQSNSFDRKIQIKGGLLEKFEHEQSTAASTWTINHGLSTRYPVITVYDSTNEVVLPMSITASSATQTTITFPVSVAGFATLVG